MQEKRFRNIGAMFYTIFCFYVVDLYVSFAAMSTVTGDLGIPEQAQHIKSVEEMETYR